MTTEPQADAERYERERAFHDDRFAEDRRSANRFYGEAFQAPVDYLWSVLDALPADAHVLEFGCGPDAQASMRAAAGGRTGVGFDLSSVAVDRAREQAQARGYGDQLEFHVMNAEDVRLPDGSFDFICGTGVLHHLALEKAFAQLARLLRPGGRAVFIEPMGHNPVINLYRRRTPDQRTDDEHPLKVQDFDLARRYFREVRPEYFGLTSLATLPSERIRHARGLGQRLERIDRSLFRRVPAVGRFAWLVALDLASPR